MPDSPSTFAERLQAFWHGRRDPWLALWTLPLSWLFAALAGLRRAAFACGLLRRERLPAPVVVVGNIHVGGAGKTLLTLALLAELRAAGLHPGVISRGYGGAGAPGAGGACPRRPGSSWRRTLAVRAQAGFAVAIGRRRSEAGGAAGRPPEVTVILADDGLHTTRWRATSSWRWWTAGAVWHGPPAAGRPCASQSAGWRGWMRWW